MSSRARAARVVGIAILSACICIAVPTSAQPAEQEAEREYRLGYRALEAGDCVKALVHYRRSLELVPRPRTLFNIATCEESLARYEAAWRNYLAFLNLAEERDASIVVEARARIEALRKRLRGTVSVTSTPAGASVTADGERQPRGETPVTLSLEPGRHVVRISMPGAVAVERTVEIAPDEASTLHVELALSSMIKIEVDPADAMIEARDHAAAGQGRLEVPVQPGRHDFTIRRDGYHSEDVAIDAVAGRVHEVRVNLRPALATATLVIAKRRGAAVTIDGASVPVSTTSPDALEVRELSVGAHAISVAPAGRPRWRGVLQFSAGDIVTLELPPPPSRARRALAWSVGGLGAASVTAGGVVGVLALRDVTSPEPDVHDRGKMRALVADGLFVVGAAALVTAWRLVRHDSSPVIHRAAGAPR